MGLDRAFGRQEQASAAGTAAAHFFALARDYDRWGLSSEADVARHRGRQATINRLLIDAKAVSRERGPASL